MLTSANPMELALTVRKGWAIRTVRAAVPTQHLVPAVVVFFAWNWGASMNWKFIFTK